MEKLTYLMGMISIFVVVAKHAQLGTFAVNKTKTQTLA
jgi:hypothetical protein